VTLQFEVFDDEVAYAEAITAWLEKREAENSLFLGILEALKKDRPPSNPFMMRASKEGETAFAAMYREINLLLTRGPDAAVDGVAARLGSLGVVLPGAIGPARETERFATAWAKHRGQIPFSVVEQRIYELDDIHWPAPVPGRMRQIRPEDLELVALWAQNFDVEALLRHERRTLGETRNKVFKRIREGDLFGWEHQGQLVSMAGLARPTSKTISVNSVYTPPERRRRGFATALVAAVSEEGFRRGKATCVLYTDVSNPTSNSIYQKIGYRHVGDSRNYHFQEG